MQTPLVRSREDLRTYRQTCGPAGGVEEATAALVAPRAAMFDSSQYPYNCFNDDADDYPAGSSDEEKRLTRPAYR